MLARFQANKKRKVLEVEQHTASEASAHASDERAEVKDFSLCYDCFATVFVTDFVIVSRLFL